MKRPTTKAELLAVIEEEWSALQDAISTVAPAPTEMREPENWPVKDQVAHVAAWERSLIALLTGQSRAAAVGMDESAYAKADIDQINAHIASRAAETTYSDVLAQAHSTHTELVGILDRLSWEELGKPYAHFQPGSERSDPALDSVLGNTAEHYAEHLEYLERASATIG